MGGLKWNRSGIYIRGKKYEIAKELCVAWGSIIASFYTSFQCLPQNSLVLRGVSACVQKKQKEKAYSRRRGKVERLEKRRIMMMKMMSGSKLLLATITTRHGMIGEAHICWPGAE